MAEDHEARRPSAWMRVIGIVGGLGPYAHLELERRLLAAVKEADGDQSYPPWLVSSIPETPDRTAALLGTGPSPVPWLIRSLERLEAGGADFAVIACNTAYAFLDEIAPQVRLPILHLVAETLLEVKPSTPGSRVGLLATTGTLRSDLYRTVAARYAPELEIVTLLDLPGGEDWQEQLVMRPIYGRLLGDGRSGGLKTGHDRDPETGKLHADSLREAVRRLAAAGADCVVAGCTEIPLAIGRAEVDGTPLVDPLEVAAGAAVRIARGLRPLPELRSAVGEPSS
ncbi:MAG: amino acid racemase [bacterium]|nr:amino acid racemase [bacterium]